MEMDIFLSHPNEQQIVYALTNEEIIEGIRQENEENNPEDGSIEVQKVSCEEALSLLDKLEMFWVQQEGGHVDELMRTRKDNRLSKRNKFLHNMRVKYKDSVPPILISAHRFTMISQHQVAAREYLEAHRLMPDNPLINLCAGTALINLGIGHRLQNKHQAVLQGLAFLYNNVRLCGESQEALFNIARAYHHVGLVSLATRYYEKVLAIREKDYPIPTLPNDKPDRINDKKPGYCDLRREAAYNLHLIYRSSGAFDLARQVLKDHVVL
ncbi:hypothetical protein OROGR_004112 [Orobanche gracilis]